EIRSIVDTECADEISRRTVGSLFRASLKKAQQEITVASSKVTDLRKATLAEIQQRVDGAVDESIIALCGDCKNDRGIGWRSSSITRIEDGIHYIADAAKERTWKIA